jgi:hypothetical protein
LSFLSLHAKWNNKKLVALATKNISIGATTHAKRFSYEGKVDVNLSVKFH